MQLIRTTDAKWMAEVVPAIIGKGGENTRIPHLLI